MRKTTLMGLAASALAVAATTPGAVATSGQAVVTERGSQAQPTAPARTIDERSAPAAWLRGVYRRGTGRPRGKRYSASVRQHQRHAAKARNRRRSRA